MTSDSQLLCTYAQTNSQDAFGELVRRYVDLVYSAALRQVGGDSHLAQDVAQSVFTDLARKAGSLSRRSSLSGWLYTSARFAAAKVVRAETRRREREEKFMRESADQPIPEAEWENLRPVLDDAMHELKEHDREAILLRFFENRPFGEIGLKLGLNENAARMRVERALDKLHGLLARRGITTTAALAAVLSAHAVQLAPTGLAAALTAGSLAAAGASAGAGTATLTLLKIMTATQLKIGAGALVVVGVATTLIIQHQRQANLSAENDALRQQVSQLSAEPPPDPPVVNVDSNALAEDQKRELLRLRGEVGVLRRQTNELERTLASARTPQARSYNIPSESASLPEDYPKTPDGATKGIFEAWARGDWNAFFTNFGEPGVPREIYDRMFNDPRMSNLVSGMEIVSLGEPTNSFGPNMWFVPYKIRFRDGNEKEFRLHVAQDPSTKRWFFKGGF